MWPFTTKYEVSTDTIEWLQDSFAWAIAQGLLSARTPLVTLSKTYFTAPSTKAPDFAQRLVLDIQRIMGIESAKIDVVPINQVDARFRHNFQTTSQIMGTWQGDGDSALISYDPELVARPVSLIATLAHEVMHNVLRGMPEPLPGGDVAEELSTDLHCITTGFGIFQMAGAEDVGWSGYMRQPSRAHALAMFLRMRGISETEAMVHLPPRSRKYLATALAWIDKNDPNCENSLVE